MAEIWRKLNNLPKLNTFLVEETVENVEVQAPKDWLKELHYSGMTLDVRDGLKQQIFSGKKPTKKEKEHLFTIIRGVYLRTNFEANDQDAKKTIEQKEKQIKELLEL